MQQFKTPDGVTVEYRIIDVEEAQRLLIGNVHNRRLRSSLKLQLAGAMRRGEWAFNGDAIRIDRQGNLLDGQHRLEAIVLSGEPQAFLVVSNLPAERQETMDQGAKRSVADMLRLRDETNVNPLAAILRQLLIFEQVGEVGTTLAVQPTPQEVLAALTRWPDAREVIRPIDPVVDSTRLTQAVTGALGTVFFRISREDTVGFLGGIATGADLPAHDPRLALLKLLSKSATRRQRTIPSREMAALVVKSWNAYREGREVKTLWWRAGGARREAFPQINGWDYEAGAPLVVGDRG